jgi:hypothetical protein
MKLQQSNRGGKKVKPNKECRTAAFFSPIYSFMKFQMATSARLTLRNTKPKNKYFNSITMFELDASSIQLVRD